MSKTQEKLTNWRGGVGGFEFDEINNCYVGSVDIHKIWLGDSNSEWFRDFNVEKFQDKILKDINILQSIYEPEYFTRIGFRLQLLLNKFDEKKLLNIMKSIIEHLKN